MKRAFVRPQPQSGRFSWATLDAGGQVENSGSDVSIKELAELALKEHWSITFIAPASDVLLQRLQFPASEARLIHKTAPYMLEDKLVESVDTQHFTLGKPAKDSVPVATISAKKMRFWLDSLRGQRLVVERMVAEQQLLLDEDCPEEEWRGYFDGTQLTMRTQNELGFALLGKSAQGLGALTAHLPTPQRMQVKAVDEQAAQQLSALLPKNLAKIAQVEIGPLFSEYARRASRHGLLNLLSGEFANAIPWKKLWVDWRAAAISMMAVACLSLGALLMERNRLHAANQYLRTEIETIYRETFPNRPLTGDVRGYLEAQLRGAKQLSSGQSFSDLLSRVAAAISTQKWMSADTINYDAGRSVLRLGVVGNNFQQIEDLRLALEKNNLEARLQSSNAEGGKVRARLLCNLKN